MTEDRERMRRRLYAPDVTAADVAAYRAVATDPAIDAAIDEGGAAERAVTAADAAPLRPVRRGRRLLAGAALLAVVIAAGSFVAQDRLRAPVPSATTPPAEAVDTPPILLRSSSQGLTSGRALQRGIDEAFLPFPGDRPQQSLERVESRARAAALPDAAERIEQGTTSGGSATGATALDLTAGPLVLQRGTVLLLTIVSKRPSVGSWRLLGRRDGDPARAHLLATVRPIGEVDRLLVAVLCVPERFTVSAVEVSSDPAGPFFFRWDQYAPPVRPPASGRACS